MTAITIWLLVVASYKHDAPHVLERFPTVEQCEHVRRNLPYSQSPPASRCIQATVARP